MNTKHHLFMLSISNIADLKSKILQLKEIIEYFFLS